MAAAPETGIITDEKLTGAAGAGNSDAAVTVEVVAAEATGGTGGDDRDQDGSGGQLIWYADSAYGTGDLRAAIAAAGHQAVIKPWPLLPAVEGGFTADDFTVDATTGTVTCPAGITRRVTPAALSSSASPAGIAPLRQRCTTAKDGRTLHLHEHDGLLRAVRADWAAGTGLREEYQAHRPHVERAIAQVATWRGRRLKLRDRGVTRNHAWLKRRTAAVTCALCSAAAWPAATPPGCWPPDQAARHHPRRRAALREGGHNPAGDHPGASGSRPGKQEARRGRTGASSRVVDAHQKQPNSAGA